MENIYIQIQGKREIFSDRKSERAREIDRERESKTERERERERTRMKYEMMAVTMGVKDFRNWIIAMPV